MVATIERNQGGRPEGRREAGPCRPPNRTRAKQGPWLSRARERRTRTTSRETDSAIVRAHPSVVPGCLKNCRRHGRQADGPQALRIRLWHFAELGTARDIESQPQIVG